jgi:hypothetical protein
LRAQPPGLADSAAHPPLGALGPAQREQALRGALLLSVRQPLVVYLAGELGELVHDSHLLSC